MAKIAVVGAGYWGPNLVRNFITHKSCDALWVCDSNPARLEWIKSRYPSIHTTPSFAQLLETDVDGIAIATPVHTHYGLAKAALIAGKHVFIEKPMAASVAEAKDLVALAAQCQRILMVGHTFEYSPPVRKIQDVIDRGELGDIYFISSMRVNLGQHQRDVSVIWDLAPHDFSVLFSWTKQRPATISAIGAAFVQKGLPDVAFISVTFPSGTVAHMEVSWLAPSKLRRTTVVGSKKMLVYDDTELIEKIKLYDRGVDLRPPENFGEFQLSYRTGDILIPTLDQTEPLAAETFEFLDCITHNRSPRTDGVSGLRVVEALAAAQASLDAGGTPIALDP